MLFFMMSIALMAALPALVYGAPSTMESRSLNARHSGQAARYIITSSSGIDMFALFDGDFEKIPGNNPVDINTVILVADKSEDVACKVNGQSITDTDLCFKNLNQRTSLEVDMTDRGNVEASVQVQFSPAAWN